MDNTRNTKQKQHILDILWASKRAMSINEIYTNSIEMFPKIAKSTIYRNIDSLLKQDRIDKYYLGENETFYKIKTTSTEHKHYVICEDCKKMFDLPVCPIHDIESLMKQDGFTVTDHYIQISGHCSECSNKKKRE